MTLQYDPTNKFPSLHTNGNVLDSNLNIGQRRVFKKFLITFHNYLFWYIMQAMTVVDTHLLMACIFLSMIKFTLIGMIACTNFCQKFQFFREEIQIP